MGLARAITLALVLCATAAWAEDAPYEQRAVAYALEQEHLTPDDAPAGKTIDEIRISSQDIITELDRPWPRLLDVFHVTTRQQVIRRELLFEEGEPYDAARIEETERNLRGLLILSIAKIVPVRSEKPGRVSLLVVTKDLWSLRANTAWSTVGTLLRFFQFRPTEENFLGLGKEVSLSFILRLDTFSMGQSYYDPRLLGSHLTLSEAANVILNRSTGQAEGSRGGLSVGLPLYSLDARNGFYSIGTWSISKTRVFRGAEVWQLPYPDETNPTASVPFAYNNRDLEAEGGYTRAFGRELRTELTGGFGGYNRRYTPLAESMLTPDQSAWLTQNHLPRSEDATYLLGSVRFFEARYQTLVNVDTFALTEDYQLGPRLVGIARYAAPAWGSPTRYLEMGVAGRYRFYLADDLFTVSAAIQARLLTHRADIGADGPWVNRRVGFEVQNISPVVWIGRFAARALVDLRAADLDHSLSFLGGGNGLRGVESEGLQGPSMVLANLEYRTWPLEFHTLHIGAVAFYDAGSAFDQSPVIIHTLGVGLRFLFPQFDKETVRVDFGVALNGPRPPFVDQISTGFGQVFNDRPAFLSNPFQ